MEVSKINIKNGVSGNSVLKYYLLPIWDIILEFACIQIQHG